MRLILVELMEAGGSGETGDSLGLGGLPDGLGHGLDVLTSGVGSLCYSRRELGLSLVLSLGVLGW